MVFYCTIFLHLSVGFYMTRNLFCGTRYLSHCHAI